MLTRHRHASSAKSDAPDFLIVGLGNPGEEFAGTRHNAGYEVIDRLADVVGVRNWKSEAGCLTAEVRWQGLRLLLAKPGSYMNTCGGPVRSLMRSRGISPDQLIVIHDELDIPAATLRLKFGGGHGGHRGLLSIAERLQTRDWYRVRVGIGRPPGAMDPADFVLSLPRGAAAEDFAAAAEAAAEAVLTLITDGLATAQQKYHGR